MGQDSTKGSEQLVDYLFLGPSNSRVELLIKNYKISSEKRYTIDFKNVGG